MNDWNFSNDYGVIWNQLPDGAAKAVTVLSLSRIKRIEEICNSMNDGSYRIEGHRIADKMVSDAVLYLRQRVR